MPGVGLLVGRYHTDVGYTPHPRFVTSRLFPHRTGGRWNQPTVSTLRGYKPSGRQLRIRNQDMLRGVGAEVVERPGKFRAAILGRSKLAVFSEYPHVYSAPLVPGRIRHIWPENPC